MRIGAHALVLQQVWPHAGAPLPCLPAPCVVDQDLAHGPRRHGEEVAAVARRRRVALRHLEVGLVHEIGGAQAVAAAPELQVGDPVQLAIDQSEQAVGRIPVAVPRRRQELGDRAGGRNIRHLQGFYATNGGGAAFSENAGRRSSGTGQK